MYSLTLSTLVSDLAHLGQEEKVLFPKLKPYVLGNRGGFSIINLERTLNQLNIGLRIVRNICLAGGRILVLESRIDRANIAQFYFSGIKSVTFKKNWRGGSLTNNEGLSDSLPDLILIFGGSEHRSVIKEAARLGIPVVGVVDTDCDLLGIDYPILCNSISLTSLVLYYRLFSKAAG
uniref:Ribosomal protein S2 n=1 Tax=Ophirina amphinema TaxID=2108040 RepID=A0A348AYT3_9EUKA|nr:ribosomal protein S2 [Ophirina amphinema]